MSPPHPTRHVSLRAIWIHLLAGAVAACADVRVGALFSDHLVLQCDRPVPIWGRAEPGEEVTVRFANQRQTTQADQNGHWSVQLAPVPAGTTGTLTIAGRNQIEIQDVLAGEVWLAAGQSNMQLRVEEATHDAETLATADLPAIRQFTVAQRPADAPAGECAGQWTVCQPATVGRFSAAAFYFAREIHQARAVPVGVINASWGATPIEAWTSTAAMSDRPELAPVLVAGPAAAPGVAPVPEKNRPGHLFNGMIAPLIPYALRGVIWYQGENNANSTRPELYAVQLPLLIEDWRRRWGTSLPFAWVQLPNFQPKNKQLAPRPKWPIVREAMRQTLAVPDTGMVVAIDIGDADNIHPRNKRDVGHRLALWARARVYGESIAYAGPLPDGCQAASGRIAVKFQNARSGLVARGGPLQGFMIAGADRRWVPAEARIEGDHVVLSSPDVSAPCAVRYGWADNPACNLFNGDGLPASPFRTDDWEP